MSASKSELAERIAAPLLMAIATVISLAGTGQLMFLFCLNEVRFLAMCRGSDLRGA